MGVKEIVGSGGAIFNGLLGGGGYVGGMEGTADSDGNKMVGGGRGNTEAQLKIRDREYCSFSL